MWNPNPVRCVTLLSAILLAVPLAMAQSAGAAKVVTHTPPSGTAAPAFAPQGDTPGNHALTGCPGLRDGWPVDLGLSGSGYPYTPTLYDADGDGAAEIFATGGHTFGLRGDGTFLPGWPTVEMTYMGYGTNGNKPGPSGADFDGDGQGEILWSLRDWWAGSSVMWCFNAKNFDGTDLPGFPQRAPDDLSNALDTPFVIGDTDGDGDLEAWAAHTLGNNFVHYRVSAFDHLGTRLFTVDVNNQENILSLYFGDLDGDGDSEMFAVSWLSPTYRLHVFQADGSEQPGYPIVLHTVSSGWLPFEPPVPADLDRDGDLEILLGHWTSARARVECYHHDGSPYPGFPIQVGSNLQLYCIDLGDVTGDGTPELIASGHILGGTDRVFAIDIATGSTLPGWPYVVTSWPKGFPTVADVDGNGLQDVIFATDSGELFAVGGDGQLLEGYPLTMHDDSISGVAVGDIDGDGLFELVAATWDGWMYAWDTPAPAAPIRADWPMRAVDARNTGVYRWACPGDLDGDRDVDLADLANLLAHYGTTGGARYADGDIDLDGDVDLADLSLLLAVYGGTCH